jgi:uncharacterized protein (DUF1697 family)
MKTSSWVLLLRGINVGGNHVLPMRELVSILEALGLEDIRTYIQSGNVVFRSTRPVAPGLSDTISAEIEIRRGFRPQVLLLQKEQLEEAVRSNPFPEAESEPQTLHVFFLLSPASAPDREALDRMRAHDERFELAQRVLYLHAPNGTGRSKLAASVEKCLGVATTARNWRTVRKLWEMVQPD